MSAGWEYSGASATERDSPWLKFELVAADPLDAELVLLVLLRSRLGQGDNAIAFDRALVEAKALQAKANPRPFRWSFYLDRELRRGGRR